MRDLKGVPVAVSVGLVLAVTAVLWYINSTAAGSYHLVYIYLFPVALIAALYSGRLALLSSALAVICADYFVQKPLYIFGNDNPLEYGDLFCFALLAITALFRTFGYHSDQVHPRTLAAPRIPRGLNHVRRNNSVSLVTLAATRSFDAVGKCPQYDHYFRANLRSTGTTPCTFSITSSLAF